MAAQMRSAFERTGHFLPQWSQFYRVGTALYSQQLPSPPSTKRAGPVPGRFHEPLKIQHEETHFPMNRRFFSI